MDKGNNDCVNYVAEPHSGHRFPAASAKLCQNWLTVGEHRIVPAWTKKAMTASTVSSELHSEHRFPAPSQCGSESRTGWCLRGQRKQCVNFHIRATLRASLSAGTFHQTLRELVTRLKGHSVLRRSSCLVLMLSRHPPKGRLVILL